MATLVAHAAVPLVTRRLVTVPPELERRLTLAAVILACWQDIDYLTLAFEVRPAEMLGHRGVTHSLLTAALLAFATAFIGFRSLRGTRTFWIVLGFLFATGASHGVLDALTAGDIGVAFFAPLSNARFDFPFKLIASCPGGVDEFLGYWGIVTIANEVLYVVVPLALAVTMLCFPERMRRLALMTAVWGAGVVVLRMAWSSDFTPMAPRPLMAVGTREAGSFDDLPRDGLPGGTLVTRLDDLRALGLLDRPLKPHNTPWSSSYFPTWLGGEGGRWMDSAPTLVWRTFFGFHAPSADQARAWLAADAEGTLFRLAPLEKVDLALGRLAFPAENQSLALGHNMRPRPRYWSGRCNGIAAAALAVPEPFRVVDVITKDGAHVRFHPNDIKALLGLAYDDTRTQTVIGDVCTTVAFDAPAICSMSPGVLLVAGLNRIGLAGDSFLVDALPTFAKQYYAVAAFTARVVRERPVDRTPTDPPLVGKVASLADVDMDLVLSSTTLRSSRANVPDEGRGRYRHVGVVPVTVTYHATLALGPSSEIIGGRWTGDPPDGPDDVVIATGGPKLTDAGNLSSADQVPWWLVEELARASADDSAVTPTVDLRGR